MKDFFISYNQADREVAAWIDQQLRTAGYSTTFQLTDMPPGSAFVHEMDKAIEENTGLIAVLSPDYLKAPHCKAEWQAFYQKDPNGEQRALIPVRVRACKLQGLLSQCVYIDLVGKTGEEAKQILLAGVKAAREKLELPARYPLDDLLNRYFDQLRQKVSTVRIFGDAEAHPLDQVFVELTINEEYERRPNQAEFLGLMDAELRRMRSVFGDAEQSRDREGAENFDQRAFAKTKRTIKPDNLLRRHTHAVVTGAPGCGKTTLLRYLTWQTLKQWRDAFVVPPSGGSTQTQPPEGGTTNARFPVFLELKQLTAMAFQQARGQLEELLFAVGIADTLRPGQAEGETLKDYFFNLLRAGRVAVFLDGLDEVSGTKFFDDLQKATQTFLQSVYGGNTVIISTRPFALPRFADAKEMEILPLNSRQIEQFIAHYYRDVPERQQFQRELQRRRELRELARVPALLGFILQLWRKHGSVTDDKLELYEQITHELAQQLDREKEGIAPEREWLVEDKDGSLKLDLLRQLAFNQLFKGLIHPPFDIGGNTNDVDRLVFTSEQLRAEAAAFASTLKEREGITINPRNLAEDVKATTLLRQVGADHYAFAHLTLQEYLAAWQLAKRDNSDTCERIFCRAYFNPTLAEREMLPMTLGLTCEADKLYAALELLPETPLLLGLRLRIRGVGYGAGISLGRLTGLLDKLHQMLVYHSNEEQSYRRPILGSLWFLSKKAREYLEEKLIQDLSDRSSFTSEMVAESLTVLGSEKAFLPLVKALNPSYGEEPFGFGIIYGSGVNESRTNYICRALARIDPQKAVPILASISTSYTYGPIDRILQEIGTEDAFKALLARSTRHSYGDIARAAWELLVQCENSEVEDVLVNALNDTRDNLRRLAVEILGRIGKEEHVEKIAALLNDKEFAVRWRAANALEHIGSEKGIGALLEALQDKRDKVPDVRWCAARALGATRSEKPVDGLVAALDDPDVEVQYHAASALGWIKSEKAAEALAAMLTRCKFKKPRVGAIYALCHTTSEKALGPLIHCLSDVDAEIRAGAAAALGEIHSEASVEALINCLSDESQGVRQWAMWSLGNIGLAGGVSKLIEALRQTPEQGTDKLVIRALGNIGKREVIEPLLYALSSFFTSFDAAQALARVDRSELELGLPPLFQCARSRVRKKAIQLAVYYCNGQGIFHSLVTLARTDPDDDVRTSISASLASYERKLQYFNIPIPTTTTNNHK